MVCSLLITMYSKIDYAVITVATVNELQLFTVGNIQCDCVLKGTPGSCCCRGPLLTIYTPRSQPLVDSSYNCTTFDFLVSGTTIIMKNYF